MFLVLETFENMWVTTKHCSRNKNVSKFVGKHSCFLGSKLCFRSNVFRGSGRQRNIDKKDNDFVIMFLACPGLKTWIKYLGLIF